MVENLHLRTWAEIDLDAIINNVKLIKSFQKNTKMLAIVKADAYGHGAIQIARVLEAFVDYFGVARPDEAVELRRAGITAPVLILGHTAALHFPVLLNHDITQTVYSGEEAATLQNIASEYGTRVKVHIALDTGMSRIGFADDESSVTIVKQICSMKNLEVEGIFSHLADADNSDGDYTSEQVKRFDSFCSRLEAAGVHIPIRHLYNSAGSAALPEKYEMVREGIFMYGMLPDPGMKVPQLSSLVPAMSLRAEVIFVKTLQAGVPVSYGCTYVTKRETIVATVCAGYADGVVRKLSNRAEVIVNGRRARIIGRICMDMFMIDATDIPEVKVGSVVTIFGRDNGEMITASEIAGYADTIHYEIICGISKRVPRVYFKSGEIFNIHYGIPHEE